LFCFSVVGTVVVDMTMTERLSDLGLVLHVYIYSLYMRRVYM